MTTLNKVYDDDFAIWETPTFVIERGEASTGYMIRNRNTRQIEAFADHETSAVLSALWLQESYDEVMEDPEREFARRKAMKHSMTSGPKIVN